LPLRPQDVHDPRVPLRYLTWPGIHAGFHAEADGDPDDGLLHAGETWAGGSYFVGTHEHPVWEIYLQAHGTTRWRVRDDVHLVGPGGVLAVPPGVPHALADRPGSRHHFFYAALDPLALVDDPDAAAVWRARDALVARHGESMAGPFRALVRELVAVRAWQPLALRAAATLLVLEAGRVLHPDGGSAAPLARPTSPAVVRARRLLDERYGERWRVADLAAGTGLSTTHLAELFTRDVGVPPHRYLLERRIERAAELLAGTDLPVTAVALEVGFGSGQHLARAFRAATGCTPRDYRRSHQR
jgi:AraC-like DNA-binding protein